MNEYTVTCPCCNKSIRVLIQDGKISVFFDVQNQDDLKKILSCNGIELGIVNGGETIG